MTTTTHFASLFYILIAGIWRRRRRRRWRVNHDLGEGRFMAPKDLDRIFRNLRRQGVWPMSDRKAIIVAALMSRERRWWPRMRGRPSER